MSASNDIPITLGHCEPYFGEGLTHKADREVKLQVGGWLGLQAPRTLRSLVWAEEDLFSPSDPS